MSRTPPTPLDSLDDSERAVIQRATQDAFLLLLARLGGQASIPVAELDVFPKFRSATVRVEDHPGGPHLVFRLVEAVGAEPARPGGFVKPQ